MPNHGSGPIPARVMIVGENWGEYDESRGQPFQGPAGAELQRLLFEAGIPHTECFLTNLVNRRPPGNDISHWIALKKKDITPAHVMLRDRWVLPVVRQGYDQLLAEISTVRPNIIVAFGNAAMWALTGKWGIRNWRGSHLTFDGPSDILPPKVIPTISPMAVLREWSQRAAVLSDLRRVRREMISREYIRPDWKFIIRPSFGQTMLTLSSLLTRMTQGESLWLDLDFETRAGHIACCGISWSTTEAICIPFMCVEDREGYWQFEEESQIVWMLYQILTHPRASIRWQNGLYDVQYAYRHWHFIPRGAQDTMISQHTAFSDQPKSLSYQASIYSTWYVYWKDEGKTWNQSVGEDQLWSYNCEDCIYTRVIGEVEQGMIEKMDLNRVHQFQQAMFWPVFSAMTRGVRVLHDNRNRLAAEVQEQIASREQLLFDILGHPINPRSSAQLQKLFYTDLDQSPVMTRAKKGSPSHVTCDDEALEKLASRESILRPIVNCIADIRTLEIFLGNFILAPLDIDGRMRCSYNIGGSESGKSAPKTYRLSSSSNAFGTGTNLQNIPSEKSKSVGKAAKRGHIAALGDPYALPNVRSLFGPDPGYTFFDMDLDRADLQVVVWEAEDEMLKAALRQGVDIHTLNAYVVSGKEPPPMEELVESHPRYPDHKGPMKYAREFAKVFCHATNYTGQPRTVAAHTGRTVHEIDRAQKIWFGAHPGIKTWHNRVQTQITRHRFVENKFGYRWYIFDRIDGALAEAVAWIPQSTVSIVINRIWMNIFQGCHEDQWDFSYEHIMKLLHSPANMIQILLQVHDSLGGQFPTHSKDFCMQKLQDLSRVVVPYDDPLIIPTGIGTSDTSWGGC